MRHILTEATSCDVADGSPTHIAGAVYYYTRGELSMKFAIVTLLLMTSNVATVAVAQDGTGHGPPMSPIIVMSHTHLYPRCPHRQAPFKSSFSRRQD